MTAIETAKLMKTFTLTPHQDNSLYNRLFGKRKTIKFKAIDNVSIKVEKGEFIGIVGDNGCGKSTLLKLLLGIYEPDSGSIKVNGSIMGVIELGIGFKSDLSAVENIMLAGIMLGIPKKKLLKDIKSIISFAGLEGFEDVDLRCYSSGMKARLAISVVLYADRDIYLFDEALAVGDNEFKKKAIDEFKKLKKKGKTLLFSSHNFYLVKQLCNKVIWMKDGTVMKFGDTKRVLKNYTDDSYMTQLRMQRG